MKLRIENVMMLDLTELTTETADTIDSIQNCMIALFSPASAPLQSRLPFGNLMKSAVVPAGAHLHSVNGSDRITAAPAGQEPKPTFFQINGKLTVEPDVTVEQLQGTVLGGIVNGVLICSTRQAEVFRAVGVSINGRMVAYPDGVRLHDGTLSIDANFLALAQDGETYMATGDVRALEDGLAALIERNIRLMGSSLLVRAQDLPLARQLWKDDAARIRCVPEGYTYAEGGLKLDRFSLRRYGPAIYVDGDCSVSEELTAEQLTAGLTKLAVRGRLTAPERLEDALFDLCETYGSLLFYPGKLMENTGSMELSSGTLEGLTEPVTLYNAGFLQIKPDVTPELLRAKVQAIHCYGEIQVPNALHGVVLSLAKEMNGHISILGAEEEQGAPQPLDPDIRVIGNTMEYKLI